jgi:hypothetical protein
MKEIFYRPLVPTTLLLASVVLIIDCTAPQRKAHEVWKENEQVIVDLALGKNVYGSDFEQAIKFFHALTDITIPYDQNAVIDYMPIKQSATALKPLRRWYAENKNRLYWDEERHEVRLAPLIGCPATAIFRTTEEDRLVRETWMKHEAAVKLAIEGKQQDDDFIRAYVFFEDVIGVRIHVNFLIMKLELQPEAAGDFRLIQAWYRENSERLYWDEEVGAVKALPAILDAHQCAIAEWSRNMEILRRGLAGGPLRGDELESAALFFENLTGETRQDAASLKQWFAKNKDRLYWDQQRKAVRLAPAIG